MLKLWLHEKIPGKEGMRELRKRLSQTKPTVHIGKNGITAQVLNEIKRQLRDKGYVKVKIEKSVIRILEYDRKEVAEEVAERLGAVLVDVRGRTFILADPKKIMHKRENREKDERT